MQMVLFLQKTEIKLTDPPEPLHAVEVSSLAPRLENIIATFDRRCNTIPPLSYSPMILFWFTI